jgi:pyruvate formate lyase activating enzyme
MKQASHYKSLGNGIVRCILCPHYCLIADGERGICYVRHNLSGFLYTELFEKVSSIGVDPIEKKPLYHFYPGSKILSIGSLGCNMKCSFCQNYRISQTNPENFGKLDTFTAEEIVVLALKTPENIGIAFTYNEPWMFYEYMFSISELAKNAGLKTVMVTNGYINRKPLEDLLPVMDAFNVDLKAFTESFYSEITQSKLEPVKKTIARIAAARKHLEITNLVIPGLNDNYTDFERMIKWIVQETGDRTPFHISRYFPNYKLRIDATPIKTLLDLYEIAALHLKYVYLGNVMDNIRESTYCDQCGQILISREGYFTKLIGLDRNGNCTNCSNHIIDHI